MQIDYANLNVVQQVAAASNCEHEYCHGPDYIPGSLYEIGDPVNLYDWRDNPYFSKDPRKGGCIPEYYGCIGGEDANVAGCAI